MAQTVIAPRLGVSPVESVQNAAMHGPRDRSTVKGVTLAESTANAITNTASASE